MKFLKRLLHRLPVPIVRLWLVATREVLTPLNPRLCFLEANDLGVLRCVACDHDRILIAPYPYAQTPLFAGVTVAFCQRCAFGWTLGAAFDLGDYYRHHYAVLERGDRGTEPARYFRRLSGAVSSLPRTSRRYVERARYQIAEIERHVPENYALLDFGSGPGYALHFSRAGTKHAVEPDASCEKYLAHIGARRVDLTNVADATYDAILSSHSLEHQLVETLFPTLLEWRRVLRPGGLLYVEVPNGVYGVVDKRRGQEPHTLFFSLGALRRILERAGFEIRETKVRSAGSAPKGSPTIGEPEFLEQHPGAAGLTILASRTEGLVEPPAVPVVRAVLAGTGRVD